MWALATTIFNGIVRFISSLWDLLEKLWESFLIIFEKFMLSLLAGTTQGRASLRTTFERLTELVI